MYQKKDIILFVLSGKAGSGKNTVANLIQDYYQKKKCIQISYAYYIKDYLHRMGRYDPLYKPKYRSLLQEFGIDFLKKQIDPNFLIHRVMEDIEVFSYFYDIIIITDARLKEEVIVPKEKFEKVITIRIENNASSLPIKEREHITETSLDDYIGFDYTIQNDLTEDSLKQKIESILKGVD